MRDVSDGRIIWPMTSTRKENSEVNDPFPIMTHTKGKKWPISSAKLHPSLSKVQPKYTLQDLDGGFFLLAVSKFRDNFVFLASLLHMPQQDVTLMHARLLCCAELISILDHGLVASICKGN